MTSLPLAGDAPRRRRRRKHWWLSNNMVAERYVKGARALLGTPPAPAPAPSAMALLNAALALCPRHEAALELKARTLLLLRRFRDVAEMLRDHIPSFRSEEVGSTTSSLGSAGECSQLQPPRDRVKLLPSAGDGSGCFSVGDLRERVLRRIRRSDEAQGYWRYIVLGQACYHLGMMDDAVSLLQHGRRLAAASFRRSSTHLRRDAFSHPSPQAELDGASALLAHVKLLVRRHAAANAALDAHLPSEAARHFSKLLDSRAAPVPSHFAAACFVGRASAHRVAGRLADAIADCNRALTLDPSSVPALQLRSFVLEAVRAVPDCLRDLDHLRLLYDVVLRDGKLPGPAWRPRRWRDAAARLREGARRTQEMKRRLASGEARGVDYHVLAGVRKGCSAEELERAHRLLSLRHRPERAAAFVDRVEFSDEYRDVETVRDQARMSALILYRMLQKGYSGVVAAAAAEEERRTAARGGARVALQGGFCREREMVRAVRCGIPVNCEA